MISNLNEFIFNAFDGHFHVQLPLEYIDTIVEVTLTSMCKNNY